MGISLCSKPEITQDNVFNLPSTKPSDSVDSPSLTYKSTMSSAEYIVSLESTEILFQIKKSGTKSKFFNDFQRETIPSISTLELMVLDSRILQKGMKIKITSNSLKHVQKHTQDLLDLGEDNDKNLFSTVCEEKLGRNQFSIFFNDSRDRFMIRDITEGAGLFILVDNKFKVEDSHVICFSNHQVLISNEEQSNQITLRFLKGSLEGRSFQFHPTIHSTIQVGRSKRCDIQIKDESVSRTQLTLIHDNHNWYLFDGTMNAASTNGIWFLATRSYEMCSGMIFKTGFSTFVAKVY